MGHTRCSGRYQKRERLTGVNAINDYLYFVLFKNSYWRVIQVSV